MTTTETTRDDTVAIATEFIDALDRNDVSALRPIADPDGTWWVDTGLDRAAGVDDVDPGADRPWPLHGNMGLGAKLDLLEGIETRFPGGCRQRRWNAFGSDGYAVVEVDGDGMFNGKRRYQNRYAFVIGVADSRVNLVREYLDTALAVDVFQGRNLDRRTVGPTPTPATDLADHPYTEVALRFLQGVADTDPDQILPLVTDDATWWADSGPKREVGRRDVEAYGGPRVSIIGLAVLRDRVVHLPGMAEVFANGWTIVPRRVIIGESSIGVEAASEGIRSDGLRYQNRYCFVLDMVGDRIGAVREYCDTYHVFDVFGVPRIAR